MATRAIGTLLGIMAFLTICVRASAEDQHWKFISFEVGTALEEPNNNYAFFLGPHDDLYAVKTRNTSDNHFQVYVASASSKYRTVAHYVTPLAEDPDNYRFAIRPDNGDLYLIKVANTNPDHTYEIHILSAASGYREFDVRWEIGPS